MFSTLDRAEMGVWEALDLLNELREYEAALMSGAQQQGLSHSPSSSPPSGPAAQTSLPSSSSSAHLSSLDPDM